LPVPPDSQNRRLPPNSQSKKPATIGRVLRLFAGHSL
jgi:hypothetical protein